jgi:hypothetical protein
MVDAVTGKIASAEVTSAKEEAAEKSKSKKHKGTRRLSQGLPLALGVEYTVERGSGSRPRLRWA